MRTSVENSFSDQGQRTPTRSYHLFRGLVLLLAFVVGVFIGFIGWPWSIKS